MRFERMGEIEDDLFAKIKRIRATKGQEYATVEDTLADFKEVAKETGTTPIQVWATYVKKHLRAIDTYVREGEVKSESIEGRALDVIVYHILLLGLIEDLQSMDKVPPLERLFETGLKCGVIGTVRQHGREDATICCELASNHPGVHYGRTAEHHGYQWSVDGDEAVSEEVARAARVFAEPDTGNIDESGGDPY